MMKQKTLLMLLASSLSIFTSCGEKEDDPQQGNGQGNPEPQVAETVAKPESVDLGLSVKWATFNVGATKPEESGWIVAWGETSKSENSDWSSYLKGIGGSMTKSQDAGTSKDPLKDYAAGGSKTSETIKGTEYDVARVKLSEEWRMATKEELLELKENCTWTWYEKDNQEFNGVAGYKVTSKMAGYTDKYIFLPATDGTAGKYWSASSVASKADKAASLCFDSSKIDAEDSGDRYLGYSVRPVTALTKYDVAAAFRITHADVLSLKAMDVTLDDKDAIEATMKAFSNLDTSVQEILSTEKALLDALKEEFTYFHQGVKYVQLWANGPKWATCNLGATKPGEVGDYFAWGEVKTKEDFSWTTYLTELGATMTKSKDAGKENDPLAEYVYYGSLYEKTIKGTEYDAARAILGGDWRMPTKEDFDALHENCTWKWCDAANTQFNGVPGFKISSNVAGNDRYIFLPVSGCKDEYPPYIHSTENGFYWTATPGDMGQDCAFILKFDCSIFGDAGIYTAVYAYRYDGLVIRPVMD